MRYYDAYLLSKQNDLAFLQHDIINSYCICVLSIVRLEIGHILGGPCYVL